MAYAQLQEGGRFCMERRFPASQFKDFFIAAFEKAGVPEEQYKPMLEALIETSLRGVDSHGLLLIPNYIRNFLYGRVNKKPRMQFKQTAPGTGIFDADHTFGVLAGLKAMEKAVELAKKNGIGAVAVINSSHFAAAGIYGLLAARNNMIGISVTHAENLVVPYGGKRSFLGTNPFCFAAPMEGEEPFCLDMATSPVARHRINSYREKGIPLEPNWIVDSEGQMTTDPNKFAALMHFGGYKGYGLALMIEILCSTLTGMPIGIRMNKLFGDYKTHQCLGHFFIAIDISKFRDINTFKRELKELCELLRHEEPAKGYEKVMVAGDPQKQLYADRVKNGIPIADVDLKKLEEFANEIGMDFKRYF